MAAAYRGLPPGYVLYVGDISTVADRWGEWLFNAAVVFCFNRMSPSCFPQFHEDEIDLVECRVGNVIVVVTRLFF